MIDALGPTFAEYMELPHKKRAKKFEKQLDALEKQVSRKIKIVSSDFYENDMKFLPLQVGRRPANEVLDEAIVSRRSAARETTLGVTLSALTAEANGYLGSCLARVTALVAENKGVVRLGSRKRSITSGPETIALVIHFETDQ